ncbi:MAG: hypothetical protein JW825_03225 [Candidatus Methanofastidiosa archaeon]|nr:hypothetical protein [Candidatus Methanofastidiosa archaeon]
MNDLKADTRVIFFLILVQIGATLLAWNLLSKDVEFVEGGAGYGTSFAFFVLIIFVTVILLAIIRLGLSRYLYLFTEYFGLFFILLFIAGSLTDSTGFGLLASISVLLIKLKYGENRIVLLFVSLVICIGISSIIGITFGPLPLILLLVLLSIYDFIAVKKTKHMISMAEDVLKKKGPQLLSFSSPTDEIIIGIADIIFPSALFVSVYISEGMPVAIATSFASIVGLMLLFKGPINEGMPAIPFVSLGIVGYIVGILLI